ncbi:MAG: citrate/2-methylcitrate synthase [Candidatus Hydrogenedentes bacterium]|nr:citrate/2-methylcitrate synthase [Candidatus Hydrogenedentota bacterium]
MHKKTQDISNILLKAAQKARRDNRNVKADMVTTTPVKWPVECTVGPGLEGAIACQTRIGYVDGSRGRLVYRGYDVFDLCAHSTFEEVVYLLLHGHLPRARQLASFKKRLATYRYVPSTLRQLMSFPIENMHAMAGLRLGTNLMRQEFTFVDKASARPNVAEAIDSDEDSIPMETRPMGEEKAIYEFKREKGRRPRDVEPSLKDASSLDSCYHLISGVATITAAIARLQQGRMPIEPDMELSHAGNFLYMMTGRKPTPEEERVMDIALILHADHGMNASTFAAMVVASTLSDLYLSIGSGIAALSGPLHGGANEQVLRTLIEIGDPANVPEWFEKARARKRRIMGFGHRVDKTYDPRARILGPIAQHLAKKNKKTRHLYRTARALEKEVVAKLGAEKGIFPNVDFYSGLVYHAMGIPNEMFTPIFAVSRVAGWTARTMEYLRTNRIFRPRAMYVGPLDRNYIHVSERNRRSSDKKR